MDNVLMHRRREENVAGTAVTLGHQGKNEAYVEWLQENSITEIRRRKFRLVRRRDHVCKYMSASDVCVYREVCQARERTFNKAKREHCQQIIRTLHTMQAHEYLSKKNSRARRRQRIKGSRKCGLYFPRPPISDLCRRRKE